MKNYVIDLLIKKLEDYEDNKIYVGDLAYTLLEQYNIDGSITYSTYNANEWIRKNIYDIYDYLPTIKFNFGDNFYASLCMDLLDNSEKAMVIIVIEKANDILCNLDYIQDNWDTEITLDKKTIEIIKKELEEQKECDL